MNAAARAPMAGARWVLFSLDAGRFALPLDAVERIIRAAAITPLPLAPDSVSGVLDIAGEILPVFDVRRRLGFPARRIAPADQFIVAHTAQRRVVLTVDAALGLRDVEALPGIEGFPAGGILSLADGIVLIQDLERFLSPAEDRALEAALAALAAMDAPGDRRAR